MVPLHNVTRLSTPPDTLALSQYAVKLHLWPGQPEPCETQQATCTSCQAAHSLDRCSSRELLCLCCTCASAARRSSAEPSPLLSEGGDLPEELLPGRQQALKALQVHFWGISSRF